jgi:hypothetical protein
MGWFLSVLMFIGVTSLSAQVTQSHVESMLDQMVRENVISKEEAEKARGRLKTLTPNQWSEINKQTAIMAERSPASVAPSNNKIEEVNNIDLDGAQFKAIETEMKRIIPESREAR